MSRCSVMDSDHERAYGHANADTTAMHEGPCAKQPDWLPRGMGATKAMCPQCAREALAKKEVEHVETASGGANEINVAAQELAVAPGGGDGIFHLEVGAEGAGEAPLFAGSRGRG